MNRPWDRRYPLLIDDNILVRRNNWQDEWWDRFVKDGDSVDGEEKDIVVDREWEAGGEVGGDRNGWRTWMS